MAGAPPLRRGVVFFAHGSRDPAWAAPFEAVAREAQRLDRALHVQLAYLEQMAPTLAEAVAAAAAAGVRELRIVPLFLGRGRHVRADLARLVAAERARHPEITFELTPAIGEFPAVVAALARAALTPLAPPAPPAPPA